MSFGQVFSFPNFPRPQMSASGDSATKSTTSVSSGSTSTGLVSPAMVTPPALSSEALRLFGANPSAGPFPFQLQPRLDLSGRPPGFPDQFRNFNNPMGPFCLPFPGAFVHPGMPQMDLKSPDSFPGAGAPPGFFYDPGMTGGPYPYGADRFGNTFDLNGVRRKNATRETTQALKAWLYEHRKNPYPTKGEKIMLAIITKMTLTQVSTWFANARRRLKKENKMTWSPRNRTGEEDDEDFSDAGDDENLTVDESDGVPEGQTAVDSVEEVKCDKTTSVKRSLDTGDSLRPTSSGQTPPAAVLKSECPTTPVSSSPSVEPAAKKKKIWSIAETVGCSNDSPAKSDSTESTQAAPMAPPAQNLFSFAAPPNFPFPPWNPFLTPTIHTGRPPMFGPINPAALSQAQAGFLSCLQMRPEFILPTPGSPSTNSTSSVPKTNSDAGVSTSSITPPTTTTATQPGSSDR